MQTSHKTECLFYRLLHTAGGCNDINLSTTGYGALYPVQAQFYICSVCARVTSDGQVTAKSLPLLHSYHTDLLGRMSRK